MSSGVTELHLQGAMRAHKIVDRIFQIDVALQVSFLLGVRQCLAHQASIAVARR